MIAVEKASEEVVANMEMRPPGLKPALIVNTYAALKRRSSTLQLERRSSTLLHSFR
jgi:hypothetical protein